MKKKFLLGLAAILLPWTAWADEEGTIPPASLSISGITENQQITYNGDKTAPTYSVLYYDGFKAEPTATLDESQYSVSLKLDDEEVRDIRNVGSYEMTITGTAGVYTMFAPVTVKFTVKPKEVTTTLELTSTTKTYGQKDSEVFGKLVKEPASGVLAEGKGEFDDFLKCLEMTRNSENSEDVKVTEQEGVYGGYQIIVNGKSAKEAKKAGSNYIYTAPGTGSYATLTIEPLTLTVTVTPETYNGEDFNSQNSTKKLSDLVSTISYGDGEDKNETLPYGDKLTATLSYNGKLINASATPYKLNVELAAVDAERNDSHETKVTNYIVETADFTINQAILTITEDTQADEYDESWKTAVYGTVTAEDDIDFSSKFKYESIISPDTRDGLHLAMKRAGGIDVDEYAIMPYVGENAQNPIMLDENGANTSALANYKIVYAKDNQVAFTITGKPINSSGITIDMAEADLIYKGEDFTKDNVSITVKDGENTTLVKGTDYEITAVNKVGDTEYGAAKNAGDKFTVTIKGLKNYATKSGEADVTVTSGTEGFEITKAPLTIKQVGETIGKVYGDADPELLPTEDTEEGQGYYTITGWKNEEDEASCDLKIIRHGNGTGTDEDVDTYNVYLFNGEAYLGVLPTLDELSNYKFQVADGTATMFTITKKTATYHIAAANAVYGDKTPDFTVEIDGLIEADKDKTADVIFMTKPVVELAELKEGQDAQVRNVDSYDLVLKNEEEVEAKNYDLTYENTEEGHKDGQYTITKAPLTITAPDVEVNFGTVIDEEMLAGWNVWNAPVRATFIGNKYNDGGNLRKLFTLTLGEGAQTGATGVYKDNEEDGTEDGIIVNVKNAVELTGGLLTTFNNYEITPVNGTLTIKGVQNLVLNGIYNPEDDEDEDAALTLVEKLEQYDGAIVEKVTVRNFRANEFYEDRDGFGAEKWYTLVLPFDISVRDLSNAFGYAIVNVPDPDNTNSELAKFKFHMGEIKANTLVVFKVDDIDKIKGKDITFENVKIVEPEKDEDGEYVWSTIADITYKGTYEDYVTLNNQNEYWVATNGGYYSGSTTIYPLSGFISYKENPANARLSLENPDGSTTVINAISVGTIMNTEGWYTIGGVKLEGEPTQKGIYINNGKKVVIK